MPDALDERVRPRGAAVLARVGLEEPGAPEGLCGVAALWHVLHLDGAGNEKRVGNGRGAHVLTLDDVMRVAAQRMAEQKHGSHTWLSLEQLCDVAKTLGAAYFRVFPQSATHQLRGAVAPLMDETFRTRKKSSDMVGLTLVAHDDHVAVFRDHMRQGPGLASSMPGIDGELLCREARAAGVVVPTVEAPAPDGVAFVTTPGAVHAAFAACIAQGEPIPPVHAISPQGEITAAVFGNTLRIQHEHYELAKRLSEKAPAGTKMPKFSGESPQIVALDVAERAFRLMASRMSPGVWSAVRDGMRYVAAGWKTPDAAAEYQEHPDRFLTYDNYASFPSALLEARIPILTPNDDFRPFGAAEEVVEHGLYWVDAWAPPVILGLGVYPGPVVAFALEKGWIARTAIGQCLVVWGGNVIRPDRVRDWISWLYAAAPTAKKAKMVVNAAVGASRATNLRQSRRVEAISVSLTEVSAVADTVEKSGRKVQVGMQEYPIDGQEQAARLYTVASSRETIEVTNRALLCLYASSLSNLLLARNIDRVVVGGWENTLAVSTDAFVFRSEHRRADYVHPRRPTFGDCRPSEPIKKTHALAVAPTRMWRPYAPPGAWTGIGERYLVPPFAPEDLPESISAPALLEQVAGRGLLIRGAAGHGKTYRAGELIAEGVKRWGEDAVLLMAPTRTAARSASAHAGKPLKAYTVHKALAIFAGEKGDGAVMWTSRTRLVVLDECFMADEFLIAEILRRALNTNQRPAIVLVGDDAQVKPVNGERLSVTGTTAHVLAPLRLLLTKNHRMDSADPDVRRFGEITDTVRRAGRADLATLVGELVEQLPSENVPRSFAFTNAVRERVNAYWQQQLGGGARVYVGQPWVAEKTMCKGELVWDNGTRYTVESTEGAMVTLLEDDSPEKITIPVEKLLTASLFSLGYCTTIHRAQGCTVREPFTIYELESRLARETDGWIYTAITRAQRLSQISIGDLDQLKGAPPGTPGVIYGVWRRGDSKPVYVGRSRDFKARVRQHLEAKCDTPFHAAIRAATLERGIGAFEFRILEEGVFTDAGLARREQEYIDLHGTCRDDGYNQLAAVAGRD
eukprot:TRINITY_DN1114_c1_g1_i5.p1 TRINITY_DN1114_c1_g1~~TRINITY_DN1114_c1_g1_i5.p1  ORF type:complete len:1080 (-),score=123.12 TRINITY_DN1114_c1_g1_i5:951-4190(-)